MDGNLSADNSVGNQSTPPTGGSKSATKVIIIEIIVVIFLIGFIVGVLNFLNIISVGSFLSQPIQKITSSIPVGQPTITIKSEIDGYKVELVDKNGLITLLKSWKTFDKPYDFAEAGSTGEKNLRNINIHLTNKFDSSKFPWTLYKNKEGKEYLSSNINLTSGSLNVYIFVANNILEDQSQNIPYFIQNSFIPTLYKMTHVPPPGEDRVKREDTITKLLKDLYSNKNIYFRVTKE